MLHDVLRDARERKNVSQAQAARLAKVSRSQYRRLEEGHSVTLDTIWRVLAIFPELGELTVAAAAPGSADIIRAAEEVYSAAIRLLRLAGGAAPGPSDTEGAARHESGLRQELAQRLEAIVDELQRPAPRAALPVTPARMPRSRRSEEPSDSLT